MVLEDGFQKSIILLSLLFTGTLARAVYNTEVYSVDPHKSRVVNVNDDSSYNVLNVGRTNLYVEFLNENNYDNVIDRKDVSPGLPIVVEMVKGYSEIAIRITNNNNTRGLIHVAGVRTGYSKYVNLAQNVNFNILNIDNDLLLKTVISHGASYIPVIGSALSTAIAFFWPAPNEPSAWDEVKDEVEKFVDTKAQRTVKGILRGTLKNIEETLETCAEHLEIPENIGKSGEYFMNVADGLVGLEYQFIFHEEDDPDADNVNYYLLPMFTDVVNLKLLFYQYGIINEKKIGLSSMQASRLYSYIRRVVGTGNRGAMGHVTKICSKKFEHEYLEVHPEMIYEELVAVRTYCAINGFQHFPNWEAVLAQPLQSKKPDNPVLVYSTSFGRNDAAQTAIMTRDVIPPPLQPIVVNQTLNQPVSIEVILFTEYTYSQISGMRITYANGDVLHTGGEYGGGKSTIIDFKNSKLMNLTAYGIGEIDCLEFGFEDGRKERAGHRYGKMQTFSIPGHHIVGFFMTGSQLLDKDQAANIIVSYQLINN